MVLAGPAVALLDAAVALLGPAAAIAGPAVALTGPAVALPAPAGAMADQTLVGQPGVLHHNLHHKCQPKNQQGGLPLCKLHCEGLTY